MRGKISLGRVSPSSWEEVLSSVFDYLGALEKMGDGELAGLKPEAEPRWVAYKLMNGLGYKYGVALAKEVLEGLDATWSSFPEQVKRRSEEALLIYKDVHEAMDARNDAVIRNAFREMPELLPSFVDQDAVIETALASYSGKGVYFNDFHYSIGEAIGGVVDKFNDFLRYENSSEQYVFRKNDKGGGEFIERGLVELSEEEERALLKKALAVTNKEIAKRTHYGQRREIIPDKGSVSFLRWSNGSKDWAVSKGDSDYVMRARSTGERNVTLDANQIIVPFHPLVMSKIAPALDDLPLYEYSTEAKERGDYPEATAENIKRALREIIEGQKLASDKEEAALLMLDVLENMAAAKAGDQAAFAKTMAFFRVAKIPLPYLRLFGEFLK